jgi:DNA polymerase-4
MPTIFHIDLDAFYASVEEIKNPNLRSKPIIVGGDPERRGVVASVSYAARHYEVEAGMTTAQALRRCPKCILVPPRMSLYRAYSGQFLLLLRQHTPLVEMASIDEAFLDMTDRLPPDSSPLEAAETIQHRVKIEQGLSASVGVASNKLLAKIASSMDKPGGLVEVPNGTEAAFMTLLPVEKLWGIGTKTTARLAELGIKTIGDLAGTPEDDLTREFGDQGSVIWQYAHGIDEQPVVAERDLKSLSQERTFGEDTSDPELIQDTLHYLCRALAERLAEENLTARTIALKLRYSDYSTISRSTTPASPIHEAADLFRLTQHLWQTHWQPSRPLRLIGVSASHLVEGVQQLTLF